MANKHKNAGFTLIELLVTLGLISLVLGVGTSLFLTVERNFQRTTADNLTTGTYDVVLSRLSREIRSAESPNHRTEGVHVIDGQHMDIYGIDDTGSIYTRINYRYNNGNLERGSVSTTDKFASANPQFATITNYKTVLTGLTNTDVFTDISADATSDRRVTQIHIQTAMMENSSTYTSRYMGEVLSSDAIAALEVLVTGVTVSPETINPLAVNGTSTLSVAVTPSNATNKNVTWTSSAPAIATVDNSGNVTGITAGTAIITATAVDGGLYDTCTVTVTVPVTGVTLTPETTTINKGNTKVLAAAVIPTNATNQAVTWTSSNTSVATVNTSGTVTAVAGGTATITVTTQDGAKTDTCAVTVNVPVTGLSIPTTMSIRRNYSSTLTVTFSPSNASNKTFTCISSNTAKASVGTITGTSVTINAGSTTGTAIITVTSNDGSYSDTCTVTIT